MSLKVGNEIFKVLKFIIIIVFIRNIFFYHHLWTPYKLIENPQ